MPDEKDMSDWFTVEIEEEIQNMYSDIDEKELEGLTSSQKKEILTMYKQQSD